ncbi:MFS transporter [Hafnia psychrotolerans]|uniref:MFS transporter n=1 Tax=Hafnia psychrotolerans TaxID=1477018 RepID=A0ABQ1GGL5_9GAMM|nr:MFS transporter [Hafnia psychrotolerans]GGA43253.1 MFS transporter [Hafnia psychrotolerans]
MSDSFAINHAPARTSHFVIMLFLALALMAALLNSSAPTPLYPLYQHELGLTAVSLTLIYGAYAAGVLISLFGVGNMAGKVQDLRSMIVPALFMVFCGALLFARADSFTLLFVARLLAGMGTGALTGAANMALVHFGPKDRGKVAALIATLSFTSGLALGPIFSGIALQTGFHATSLPFILIMAISFIAALGVMFKWPSSPVIIVHEKTKDKVEAENSSLLSGLQATGKNFFLCSVALFTSWAVAASILAVGPGVSESLLDIHNRGIYGYVIAAYLTIAGISQIMSRQLNARHSLLYGCLAQTLSVLVFAGAIALHSVILAGVGMIMGGYAYGAIFVGSATLVNMISPKASHARLISLYYVIAYVANGIPILLGVVIDHASLLLAVNLLCMASAIIGIILSLMVARSKFTT